LLPLIDRYAASPQTELWRAVDAEGEVLDVLVQSKRDKHAALKLMRKLLKKYAFVPERLITDDLRSYGAAARALGLERMHERGRWRNNRPKIRISRPDDGSARCNVSRALAPRRNSSQPTPPFTTSSTSNAISYISSIAPRASRRGDDHMARGRRGRLKFRTAVPLRVVVSTT
jgi:DDE domain